MCRAFVLVFLLLGSCTGGPCFPPDSYVGEYRIAESEDHTLVGATVYLFEDRMQIEYLDEQGQQQIVEYEVVVQPDLH